MSRHPYTNSCDWIRRIVGPDVSRSQASKLRSAIAELIGIDDQELADKMSKDFMDKNDIEYDGRV